MNSYTYYAFTIFVLIISDEKDKKQHMASYPDDYQSDNVVWTSGTMA
jgi:hypothetical protein